MNHGYGRVAVDARIDVVEPVGQYAHRLKTVVEGLRMRTDVDAVGQSAEDEDLRTEVAEVADKGLDKVPSVVRTPPRANDVYGVARVEVGSSEIIQHQWCVGTLPQSLRIADIRYVDGGYIMFPVVLHLLLGTCQCDIGIGQTLNQIARGIGYNLLYISAMRHDRRCRTEPFVELSHPRRMETVHACERHGVESFLFAVCCWHSN